MAPVMLGDHDKACRAAVHRIGLLDKREFHIIKINQKRIANWVDRSVELEVTPIPVDKEAMSSKNFGTTSRDSRFVW